MTYLLLGIHVMETTRVASMTTHGCNSLNLLMGSISKITRIVWLARRHIEDNNDWCCLGMQQARSYIESDFVIDYKGF